MVDLADMATVVHQYHDYTHNVAGQKGIYMGLEAQINMKLAGGYSHLFTIRDSNFILQPEGLIKKKTPFTLCIAGWLLIPACTGSLLLCLRFTEQSKRG